MNPLSTLAATALFTCAATAAVAAPPANANFSAQGQAFSLALDGRLLTQPLARQVHVGPLAPGRHWADFTLPGPYGRGVRFRTAVWLQPGLETSYVLVLRPGYGPQLQQVGAVALYGAGPVGPGYAGTYPAPNAPYGGNYPAQPNAPYGAQPQNDGSVNGRYQPPVQPQGNYGTAPSGGYNNPNAPAQAPTPPYPGAGTAPNNGGYYPPTARQEEATPNTAPADGNYDPAAAPTAFEPLSPTAVQELVQDLRHQSLDEARLNLAKEALAETSVSADELAQLLGTLKLNKSRIDLAEYGYDHVIDQQNFARVYDVLRYPASIREVQQALDLPQD